MAGNANPIDSVLVDSVPVSKGALRSYEKTYVRKVIADTDAIGNGDWAGQIAGLHLLSDGSDWDIDTSDTTTPEDADNVRDANGILFKRVVPSFVPTSRTYTDADISGGAITLDNDYERHFINTTSAVNINYPAADDRAGRDLYVKGIGSYGWTPVLDGSDTIDGSSGSVWQVTTPKGWHEFMPTSGGYIVKSAQL